MLRRELVLALPLATLWLALAWLRESLGSRTLPGFLVVCVIGFVLLTIFRIISLEPVEPDRKENAVSARIRHWIFSELYSASEKL